MPGTHTRWTPRVTVAAIVQDNERYLMVRERVDGRDVCSQPAGHLESGESLTTAVIREVLEETCLLYTSPSPRDATLSRMPSSA